MAKVAWIGLGVMGYPDGGHILRKGGHERDRLQPHRRQGRRLGRPSTGRPHRTDAARCGAATPISCSPASATTTTCARSRSARRRIRRRMKPGAIFIDNTTASAERRPRALRRGQGEGHRLSRRAGLRRPGRRAERRAHGNGAAATRTYSSARKPVHRSLCAHGDAASDRRARGSSTKMVNQICIAGLVQGLAEAINFAQKPGLDIAAVHGVDLQGRGAVVADGQPLARPWSRASSTSASPSTGCARTCGSARRGARNGASLPVTALVDQFYAEVQRMGGNRWDTSSLIARLNQANKA